MFDLVSFLLQHSSISLLVLERAQLLVLLVGLVSPPLPSPVVHSVSFGADEDKSDQGDVTWSTQSTSYSLRPHSL